MLDRVKAHVGRYKVAYSVGGVIVVAGITGAIMRGVALQHIGRGIPVAAERGIPVLADGSVVTNNASFIFGQNKVLNNVSYIASRRQGPPSWVVRCLETNQIFTSQNEAAMLMDIPAAELSRHLNGLLDHVYNWHFERICLAA